MQFSIQNGKIILSTFPPFGKLDVRFDVGAIQATLCNLESISSLS